MRVAKVVRRVHLVENPHLTGALHGRQVLITTVLMALLGAVFLKGSTEAIGLAVVLVAAYLALNVVVVAVGLWHVVTTPHVIADWSQALTAEHGNGRCHVVGGVDVGRCVRARRGRWWSWVRPPWAGR